MTVQSNRNAAGRTAIASSVALVFSAAPAIIYTGSIYLKPMQASLGLSRGQLATCFSAFTLAFAIGSPAVGWAVDRVGAVRVARIGIIGLGGALLGVAFLAHGFAGLLVLLALAGLLGSAQAPIPYAKLLSQWYSGSRGKALAAAMTGVGLGSIVVPLVTTLLVRDFGWRAAMAAVAALVLLVAGGATFWLREPPAIASDRPAGEAVAPGGAAAWRDGAFWGLAGSFMLFGAAINGVLGHLAAILDDAHAATAISSLAIPLTGACSVVGRLTAGVLLDRSRPERVGAALFVSGSAAILLLAVAPATLAVAAAVLLGFAIGAEVDVMAYLVSRLYPLRLFGVIYGWQVMLFAVGLAAGQAGLGLCFDRFGRYDEGLYLASLASLVAAGVLLVSVGRRLADRGDRDPTRRSALALAAGDAGDHDR